MITFNKHIFCFYTKFWAHLQIIIIIIIIYISPSIDPLQGQRPTGCGSSQGTLSGYKE